MGFLFPAFSSSLPLAGSSLICRFGLTANVTDMVFILFCLKEPSSWTAGVRAGSPKWSHQDHWFCSRYHHLRRTYRPNLHPVGHKVSLKQFPDLVIATAVTILFPPPPRRRWAWGQGVEINIERTGVLFGIFKTKRYQDSVLWAWLETVFIPKRSQFSINRRWWAPVNRNWIFSSLYPQGYRLTFHCGLFKAEDPKR